MPGHDVITNRALRHLGDQARKTVLLLHTRLLANWMVLKELKPSRLILLLKAGKSPLNICSYRPISLTSCVGKVIEKVILTRLECYLEFYEIYPAAISGLRRCRSPIDNVVDLVTYVEHQKA